MAETVCIPVATGQCGNQVCYELLSQVYQHTIGDSNNNSKNHASKSVVKGAPRTELESKRHLGRPSVRSKSVDQSEVRAGILEIDETQKLLQKSLFRAMDDRQSSQRVYGPQSSQRLIARAVCLDTEPKVINSCLALTNATSSPWQYDRLSVAYQHGGAGNNWSLGYSMLTGDFLDTAINAIRRQLEHCDAVPCLLFLHSLAGGTGSGLGTHLTEEAADHFPETNNVNICIAPLHFGEIVVQHYNALLTLAKIQSCSQGITVLENEIARLLCAQQYGIALPTLGDLNTALCSHIVPLLTPRQTYASPYAAHYNYLPDDMAFLCSHPGYRFFSVRVTPQTSRNSVDYTYDRWSALIRALQRMQLSGVLCERMVPNWIKSLGNSPALLDKFPPSGSIDVNNTNNYTGENHQQDTELYRNGLMKSIASVISVHGEGSATAARELKQELQRQTPLETFSSPTHVNVNSSITSRSVMSNSAYSVSNRLYATPTSSSKTAAASAAAYGQEALVFDEFRWAHQCPSVFSSYGRSADDVIRVNSSSLLLNQYHRSAHITSNDQSILPVLRRSIDKSEKMFRLDAYTHQYTTYGVERDDFVEAFQNLGSVVQNYEQL